jgi:type II secretory pathway component PulF
LIYPGIVVAAALAVFVGLVTFLVPKITQIIHSYHGQLPALTQFEIGVSHLVRDWGWLLGLFAITAVALFRRWHATEAGRYRTDRFLIGLPRVGQIFVKAATAQFFRAYSQLIGAGVLTYEALPVAAETANNAVLSRAVMRARQDVRAGAALPVALRGAVPAQALSMLEAGDRTGNVEDMIEHVAEAYEDQVEQAIAGLKAMLEPFVVFMVGAVVLVILWGLYSPLFRLYQVLSQAQH